MGSLPAWLIKALRDHPAPMRAPVPPSAGVLAGGVYRLSGASLPLLVYVTHLYPGGFVQVVSLSPEVEYSTDLDLLLTPEETDLPYALILEMDVFGYARITQLSTPLALLPLDLVTQFEESLSGLSLMNPSGPPLCSRSDPRWLFKTSELQRLEAVTQGVFWELLTLLEGSS